MPICFEYDSLETEIDINCYFFVLQKLKMHMGLRWGKSEQKKKHNLQIKIFL